MKKLLVLTTFLLLSGCSRTATLLNPFYEEPTKEALLGEKTDKALYGSGSEQNARKALQAMASYRRAHEPQPTYPVMQPAVVRVMWVPDHLNKHGDLVPAHYYYLKVLNDRWAVQDAFDLESQLNSGNRHAGNIPYVADGDQISR